MSTMGRSTAAAIRTIGSISVVAAFSPPESRVASIAHARGARIRSSPLVVEKRNERRSPSSRTSLGSSLAEAHETESAANNETLVEPALVDFFGADADGGDPTQRAVVPSPLVLDPALDSALFLDAAAIEAGGGAAVTSVTSMITSKQEDFASTIAEYADDAPVIGFVGDDTGDFRSSSLFETVDVIVKEGDETKSETENRPTPTEKSVLDNVPSIKKILRYTLPAIGIWLCSPVLSMIDTAAVGLLSGTAQQAALNPAVSVTDQGALVVAFVYTATTNLIAASVQEDDDANANDDSAVSKSRPQTTKTLVTALKLALFVGTVFAALLGLSGELLLRILIGNDGLDPAVFSAALRYVRVRALGMPAAVVIGTAQSACLGMRDVRSPLYVLAAAAVVNFFGDVLLVPSKSAMFGGAAGAAWATVASQWAALLFFGRWLTSKGGDGASGMTSNEKNGASKGKDGRAVDITQSIMELTGASKAGASRRDRFGEFLASSRLSQKVRLTSKFGNRRGKPIDTDEAASGDKKVRPEKRPPKSRGFLSGGKLTLRNYLSFSNLDKTAARKFLPFVVPVTTTSVGRISGYVAMSHVASSTLGTYDMAAHQIIYSIFCCLAPLVDALGQVAQSFVPGVFEAKGKTRERAEALKKTVGNFRRVGAGLGAVLLFLVSRIPLMSGSFTADPIVAERVIGALPGVGLFLLFNGLMCAGEGSLLGQKDLKFLRNMYAVFFLAVPACMLRLKHRASAGLQSVGVGTMWATFATYQVIRTSLWHLRLAQLQRRTERGVVEEDAT